MMYAIINIEKCREIGIDSTHRMTHDNDVVITDKELKFSSAVGDTLEEKAKNTNAILATSEQVDMWDAAFKCGKNGKEVLNG